MTTAAAANAGLGGVGGGAGAGGVPAAGGRPRSGMDDTLASLENLIRLDTEATVGDLELLVRVNQHAAQRYRAMADAAEGLSVDAEYLSGKYAEVEKYVKQVDELDDRVSELERVVKELEEWTGELEVKVRRLRK